MVGCWWPSLRLPSPACYCWARTLYAPSWTKSPSTIGFQGLRTLGFIFLVLTDMGLVSPGFGVGAGIGDVFVGVFALYAAYALLRSRPGGRSIAIAANVIGLLDATMALVLGLFVVPAESFVPQIVTRIMFVPSYVVAIFLVAHIYSLRGLISGRHDPTETPRTALPPEHFRAHNKRCRRNRSGKFLVELAPQS